MTNFQNFIKTSSRFFGDNSEYAISSITAAADAAGFSESVLIHFVDADSARAYTVPVSELAYMGNKSAGQDVPFGWS